MDGTRKRKSSTDMDGTRKRKRTDSNSCAVSESFLHRSHESTLKNWLEENTDNWSTTYKAWGANRPCHNACKVIKAVIMSVSEFHASSRIHGSLKFEENYLLHENLEGNFNVMLVHKVVDGDISTKTQKGDMKDMLSIIFDKILAGVPRRRYVHDLKCLRALIENWDENDSDRLHIIKHPSLWNYKERVEFILQFHRLLETHPDRFYIRLKLKQMDRRLGDWTELVPSDGPLRNFLQTDNAGNYYMRPRYGEEATEHLRFFRNFLSHFKNYYTDPIKKISRCYAPDWNEMYVEFQFSEIRTNFVVKLFEMVMADTKLRKIFLF